MSKETKKTYDGSHDLGVFFLDVAGSFAPEKIKIKWSDQKRPSHKDVEKVIEQTWAQQQRRAEEENINLYNGQLCRLDFCSVEEDNLTLNLGHTDYREFVGTNLSQAQIRYTYGEESLANALGVSASVVTSDGFIVLGRRSNRIFFNAGKIDAIGGMVEHALSDTTKIDLYLIMLSELSEELDIGSAMVTEGICLGLIRDRQILQPELIFDLKVNAEIAKILKFAAEAKDSHEHTEIIPVRNDRDAVVNYIDQNHDEMTSVAIATLLLHGMNSWGSGWFATARGYLQKIT